MMSAKFWDFFAHSPLVTYRNPLILFLSSGFWGPPSSSDVIYGSPPARIHISEVPSSSFPRSQFKESKSSEAIPFPDDATCEAKFPTPANLRTFYSLRRREGERERGRRNGYRAAGNFIQFPVSDRSKLRCRRGSRRM